MARSASLVTERRLKYAAAEPEISVPQIFTHSDFVQRALSVFPELQGDFESTEAFPTLQVSAFAERLQRGS